MIQTKSSLVGHLSSKNNLKGNLNNAILHEYPELEDLLITPSEEEQHFKAEKYGYDTVTVNKIETEEKVAILDFSNTYTIEVTPNEGKYLKKVIINKDENKIPENIAKDVVIDGIVGTHEGGSKNYIPLTYVQNSYSGKQYIDTGVKASNTLEFEIKYMLFRLNRTSYIAPLGSREVVDGATVNNFVFWHKFGDTTNNTKKYFAFGNAGWELNSNYNHDSVETTATFKNNILTITSSKGTEKHVLSGVTPFESNINVWLFCDNTQNAIDSPANMRIYYCKFWKNGQLVRDFIPVTNYLGKICLYDKITKTYYQDKSNEGFTAGLPS